MKALVTGGGGFLGLYLTEQLVARGATVRVMCRGEYPRLHELGVEIVRADIRDKHRVEEACAGCDVVFHVAAVPGIWGPWKTYYETNTLGTQSVIAGCHKHHISKLIYTSSPSVIYDGQEHRDVDEHYPYPDPSTYLCHYPHSKALAEKAVLAANGNGLSTAAIRPHLIWGPRDNHLIPRLIERARQGRLRQVGHGENLVSVSYVENVAAAHLQLADHLSPHSHAAGQAYFINDPEPVNLWGWVRQILQLAGLPPLKKTMSAGTARFAGSVFEGLYKFFGLKSEPPMTRFLAAQLSGSHFYSIAKAQRDFHYQPVVSVEEGLKRLAEDLRARFPTVVDKK